MKIYLVGGAVRDMLLGLEPKDRDFVVVGNSPEQMLGMGYKQVGKDFPVFLHPDTREEYALARNERKSGEGYTGFECNWEGVTLEQDLLRRDLTMNAMAYEVDAETTKFIGKLVIIGGLIDPYNGKKDLADKVIRAVSPAFAEDPLRILRAARFAAQYDFRIDHDTMEMMHEVSKELHTVSPNRVWTETEKALRTVRPSRYFAILNMFSVFEICSQMSYIPQNEEHHPEIWVDTHTHLVMNYAAKTFKDPQIVFAAFCHDFGKPSCFIERGTLHGHEAAGVPIVAEFCEKWKVPNIYKDLAMITCEYHTKVHSCLGRDGQQRAKPNSIMKLLENTGALARPYRFGKFLKACEADSKGRGATPNQIKLFAEKEYPQADYLLACLEAVLAVPHQVIAHKAMESGKTGKLVGEAVRVARIDAIRGVQKLWKKI